MCTFDEEDITKNFKMLKKSLGSLAKTAISSQIGKMTLELILNIKEEKNLKKILIENPDSYHFKSLQKHNLAILLFLNNIFDKFLNQNSLGNFKEFSSQVFEKLVNMYEQFEESHTYILGFIDNYVKKSKKIAFFNQDLELLTEFSIDKLKELKFPKGEKSKISEEIFEKKLKLLEELNLKLILHDSKHYREYFGASEDCLLIQQDIDSKEIFQNFESLKNVFLQIEDEGKLFELVSGMENLFKKKIQPTIKDENILRTCIIISSLASKAQDSTMFEETEFENSLKNHINEILNEKPELKNEEEFKEYLGQDEEENVEENKDDEKKPEEANEGEIQGEVEMEIEKKEEQNEENVVQEKKIEVEVKEDQAEEKEIQVEDNGDQTDEKEHQVEKNGDQAEEKEEDQAVKKVN